MGGLATTARDVWRWGMSDAEKPKHPGILDVELLTWFRLYPALKPGDWKCLCGRKPDVYWPYVNGDFVGIVSGPCECGVPRLTHAIPRNVKASQKWQKLLTVGEKQ